MLKRIKHPVLFLIFAAFLSFSAYSQAQEASEIQVVENSINGILDFPINTSGDQLEYTHLWFKQILGGFIFAPWASMGIDNGNYDVNDQTVLAKALGFTNILAIIICLVIGYYLIVGGAINTAAKGEVLGQNWDGPWLAIRTSIGFGMLIPLKGIGGMTLSFSQIAVIWLIMIGSNSATLLWNMVGDSIVTGTKISEPNINPGFSDVASLSSMLVCSEIRVMHESQTMPKPGSGVFADLNRDKALTFAKITYSDGTPLRISGEMGGAGEHALYEGAQWLTSKTFPASSTKQIHQIEFADGNCGSISFASDYEYHTLSGEAIGDDWGEVEATSYKKSAKIEGSQAYARILMDTMNELLKLKSILIKKDEEFQLQKLNSALADKSEAGSELEIFYDKFHPKFVEIAKEYIDRVNNEIYYASVGNPKFMQKIKEEMMYGGWAGAGIWFMELSSIPAIPYQSYQVSKGSIEMKSQDLCGIFFDTSECETFNETLKAYNNIVRESVTLASIMNGAGNSSDQIYQFCDPSGECQDPKDVTSRIGVTFSQGILGFLGENQGEGGGNPFDNDVSLVSPFLFLGEMGQTLNDAAYGVMIGMVVVNSLMDYIKAVDSAKDSTIVGVFAKLSGTKLGSVIFTGFAWAFIKNMALLALGGLAAAAMTAMMSGFVLAYVIPFMPITTWILMMAGYMLTVVESIAAAPLAIVLLFTPEGSGIAGSRFERALNLVTMAILRPSFMVLGLIASITVSFVAFSMMNTFFFKAAEHILVGHLFDTIALLLIYTSLAYQLAKMMVENMHQLPDRIGEWFAGGVSRQFGESRVNDSAEQAVQGAGGQFKSLPTSIMGMQSAMRETKNKSKEADEMEAKSKST